MELWRIFAGLAICLLGVLHFMEAAYEDIGPHRRKWFIIHLLLGSAYVYFGFYIFLGGSI